MQYFFQQRDVAKAAWVILGLYCIKRKLSLDCMQSLMMFIPPPPLPHSLQFSVKKKWEYSMTMFCEEILTCIFLLTCSSVDRTLAGCSGGHGSRSLRRPWEDMIFFPRHVAVLRCPRGSYCISNAQLPRNAQLMPGMCTARTWKTPMCQFHNWRAECVSVTWLSKGARLVSYRREFFWVWPATRAV